MTSSVQTQSFYKMQGSGNDFIVIDNRARSISPDVMPLWAKALCPHAFSIGADGIIFLEADDSGRAATRWHFFNADGSRAEMCGNGSRCATLLAHRLGMAPAEHLMLTDAGPVSARVFAEAGEVKKGAIVTCEVTDVKDGGIEVKLTGTDLSAFIKRSELARERNDQRPERFSVGDKLDARVTLFDRKARKVQVSIKALEIAEEKEAVATYGSQDSGASLGDILGAALKQRAAGGETEEKED